MSTTTTPTIAFDDYVACAVNGMSWSDRASATGRTASTVGAGARRINQQRLNGDASVPAPAFYFDANNTRPASSGASPSTGSKRATSKRRVAVDASTITTAVDAINPALSPFAVTIADAYSKRNASIVTTDAVVGRVHRAAVAFTDAIADALYPTVDTDGADAVDIVAPAVDALRAAFGDAVDDMIVVITDTVGTVDDAFPVDDYADAPIGDVLDAVTGIGASAAYDALNAVRAIVEATAPPVDADAPTDADTVDMTGDDAAHDAAIDALTADDADADADVLSTRTDDAPTDAPTDAPASVTRASRRKRNA